jgi:hypothetical protein
VRQLGAQWKVSDVKIVEVPAIQGAMPQYKTTYSIEPQAGGSDFDDSKWPNIEPKDLAARRSGGHVAFMWYRTPLTIPAKIGDCDPSGAATVLLTPQKNGSGPLTMPDTFLRQDCRKKPVGA